MFIASASDLKFGSISLFSNFVSLQKQKKNPISVSKEKSNADS